MSASGSESGGPSVAFRHIEEARERLRPHLEETPCVYSDAMGEMTGCRVVFKFENLHRTGSFKERGALNKLLLLSDAERGAGVVTASAGNHGQALAYHATRLGLRCVVVMPEHTPLVKISSTRRWGAKVLLEGKNYDEALSQARRIEEEEGLFFVHGFDDPDVIAGQGTMTLEALEEKPDCAAMIVPVGGGGLIAGNALALKTLRPNAPVFGVEPEACPSMAEAFRKGAPSVYDGQPTIADGLAVKSAGKIPFALAREYVDDFYTVSEEEIANAILVLLEVEKTMVEGAGAAALAALLNRKELRERLAGQTVMIPLCGGNIDVNVLSKVIDRGLAKDGRLGRFRVVVRDQPGSLSEVTAVVAREGGNILDILHTRALAETRVGEVAIDIIIETRGREHLEALYRTLGEAGFRVGRLR